MPSEARKEDAIREGRRGLELADYSVLEKNDAAANLDLIYARTGETDEAIKLIEKLLALENTLSKVPPQTRQTSRLQGLVPSIRPGERPDRAS